MSNTLTPEPSGKVEVMSGLLALPVTGNGMKNTVGVGVKVGLVGCGVAVAGASIWIGAGVWVGTFVAGIGIAVGDGIGVFVAGTGVAVGVGIGVLVGGVAVGVTGVAVGIGAGVLVGGKAVGVCVGTTRGACACTADTGSKLNVKIAPSTAALVSCLMLIFIIVLSFLGFCIDEREIDLCAGAALKRNWAVPEAIAIKVDFL